MEEEKRRQEMNIVREKTNKHNISILSWGEGAVVVTCWPGRFMRALHKVFYAHHQVLLRFPVMAIYIQTIGKKMKVNYQKSGSPTFTACRNFF